AGVPIVAQMRPGVSDVVHSDLVDIQGGPKAMSARLAQLLADDAERNAAGQAARQAIVENHLLGAAAKTLTDAIQAAK
ncbi:MAG: glycosyltransferase, partial [Paracoccaceae bacterium]